MRKRISFELDETESAMLDLLMHELLLNDPTAEMKASALVHDMVRSILEDDYTLHHDRIAEGQRAVH